VLSSSESTARRERAKTRRSSFSERASTALSKTFRSKKKPAAPSTEIVQIDEAAHTRVVCILLVPQAVVSFRAVPRILHLFHELHQVLFPWVPHFTSVIHGTLRFGLAALRQVKSLNGPSLAVIDYSIDIGVKKALVVLRVPLDALSQRGAAIQLQDCECMGLRVCEHTDGETVATALTEIFPDASFVAQDLEPEAVAISHDSRTAYVALEPNNAFAVMDIQAAKVTSILPFGYKDHSKGGNGLDASDRDGTINGFPFGAINIQTWSVKGMYQPDILAAYRAFGQTYLVTPNE
jgi:hypothetical protein